MINKKLILAVFFSVMLENIVAMGDDNQQRQQQQQTESSASVQVIEDLTVPMFYPKVSSNTEHDIRIINNADGDYDLLDFTSEEQQPQVGLSGSMQKSRDEIYYISKDKLQIMAKIKYIDQYKLPRIVSPLYLQELNKSKRMVVGCYYRDRNVAINPLNFYRERGIFIDGELFSLYNDVKAAELGVKFGIKIQLRSYLCIYKIEQTSELIMKERFLTHDRVLDFRPFKGYNWVSRGISREDFLRLWEPEDAYRLGLYSHEYLNQKFINPFVTEGDNSLTWREFWGVILRDSRISHNLILQIYEPMLSKGVQEWVFDEIVRNYKYSNKSTWGELLCYKIYYKANQLKLYTTAFLRQKISNTIARIDNSLEADFSWMEFFCFKEIELIDKGVVDVPIDFLHQFLMQELPDRLINKIPASVFYRYHGMTWIEYLALSYKWSEKIVKGGYLATIKGIGLIENVFTENFLRKPISKNAAVAFPEYASCSWLEFLCIGKVNSTQSPKHRAAKNYLVDKIGLYNVNFFYKIMPADFLNQMGLPNQLLWGWYFVYYTYCDRFSNPFPKWFLDGNLPDQLMDFIYKYSRCDMYNPCHCFQVYCIAYSKLKWGEFLCAYRPDYALKLKLYTPDFLDTMMPDWNFPCCSRIPLYKCIKWKDYLLCHCGSVALKLKLVPEGFFQYYGLDENQALGLLKKFDDVSKHSYDISKHSDNLLKNYIRFYDEDLAERGGLYADYVLDVKIPDAITDRNPKYRGWTWYQYICRVRDIEYNF